ncbi:MAG: DEAD/DEAH box helicase [Anaerorhabdus sp.]
MYLANYKTFQSIMTSSKNSKLARRMYDYDDNLEGTIEEFGGCYIADCRFDYYGRTYETSVSVSSSDIEKVISYNCDCQWCFPDEPCAHVGALLLTMADTTSEELPFEIGHEIPRKLKQRIEQKALENMHYEKMKQSNLSTDLICYLRNNIPQLDLPQEDNIHLTPILTVEKNYYGEIDNLVLEFKIGNQKQYIVRNISMFLSQVNNSEQVEYGKHYIVTLNIDNFDEDSKLLINFLRKHINFSDEGIRPDSIKRTFRLEPYHLPDLFDLINNLNDKHGLVANEEFLKFDIIFEPLNDGYTFTLNPQNLTFSNNSVYTFSPSAVITKILFNNPPAVAKIYQLVQNGNYFVLGSHIQAFYDLCLEDLVDDCNLINFPHSLVKKNDVIKTELYGDLNQLNELEISIHMIKSDLSKEYAFTTNSDILDKNTLIVENFVKVNSHFINYEEHKAILDLSDKNTYDFIQFGLDKCKDYCDVYISDALKSIGTMKHYSITMGVRVEAGLLELELASNDIPVNELADVLKNYKKRRKFHRLRNGELLYLESNDLKELENILEDNHISANELVDGKIQLPLYRSFQANEVLESTKSIQINRSESFKQCLENFKSKNHDFKLNSNYQSILRDYQVEGVYWMSLLHSYGFGGILADDMGLGKTLQVLALLESINTTKPSLVVCPASLILNWADEVSKFSKDMTYLPILGDQESRINLIKTIYDYKLIITSYDYVRRDIELLKEIEFEYVILDEAQYIKNQSTVNAKTVKALKTKNRLALTGTPIENSLAELWSIFDFLLPNYLFNYHYFRKEFEVPIVKNQDIDIQNKLKRMVEPFILRRVKNQVLKELPEKFEQTISVDFSEEEEKLYLAHAILVSKNISDQLKTNTFDRIQVLSMITKLRQLCADPRILFDNIMEPSSKMNACLDIIRTFKENKKKILLFSSFTSTLFLLAHELKRERIKYHILTGETDKVTRRQLVQNFQEDDSTVFLISLKAGGTGLNLTAAEGVIHFDPWWNISAQNQATDRSHRIGQTNVVQVYKLIVKNTIEEKIVKLQETKKNLADSFVEDNEGSISKLSPEQLLDLFR